MEVHPLIFRPIFKPRIWGGRRIETVLRKPLPPAVAMGESWEVADLEDDQSVVRPGPSGGRSLAGLVSDWGPRLLGTVALSEGHFPLLLKYLDAREALSIQVHPNARTARERGGRTREKHEAWYVIEADPASCIYRGFRTGVTPNDVRRALDLGGLEGLLNRVPAKKGQCFYLPSGTVHALGAGLLVAEVQTPSDVTYRLYDWDRVDSVTGRRRELAVEDALGCASYAPFDPSPEKRSHAASVWATIARMITCPSFTIERVRMVAGLNQVIPFNQLVIWMVLEGRGRMFASSKAEPCEFGVGDTVVLPATLPEPRLQTDEDCLWLEITLPCPSS